MVLTGELRKPITLDFDNRMAVDLWNASLNQVNSIKIMDKDEVGKHGATIYKYKFRRQGKSDGWTQRS
jgi:hypothetical protein